MFAIDDLIISGKLWEEHISHIRTVLERLKGARLTAKLSKCCFGTTRTYLGHVAGTGVVRPEPSKVHVVLTFPIPATKTHVRVFLGLTGYYWRFIPNFASLAAPLTDLMMKSALMQVQWKNRATRHLRT